MKGRKANKEEQNWLSAICDLGCIVCIKFHGVSSPASPHHIDGKTKPGAHMNTIPLCWGHHQSGRSDETLVSRHPYKAQFVDRYGTEHELKQMTKELINFKE